MGEIRPDAIIEIKFMDGGSADNRKSIAQRVSVLPALNKHPNKSINTFLLTN